MFSTRLDGQRMGKIVARARFDVGEWQRRANRHSRLAGIFRSRVQHLLGTKL